MRIGFFEGIDSERGIAGRVADSLNLRQFLQVGLDEPTPDQVRIWRTRRRIDEATHGEGQRKITSVIVVDEDHRVEGVLHLHDLWTTQFL